MRLGPEQGYLVKSLLSKVQHCWHLNFTY